MPAKPPPIMTRGPWRSAEPVSKPVHESEHPWLSAAANIFIGIFDAADLGEILFGALRFVGRVVVIALHAICHL